MPPSIAVNLKLKINVMKTHLHVLHTTEKKEAPPHLASLVPHGHITLRYMRSDSGIPLFPLAFCFNFIKLTLLDKDFDLIPLLLEGSFPAWYLSKQQKTYIRQGKHFTYKTFTS